MPYFAGSSPVAHASSDCDHACAPPPSAGIAGGTNGDRLAASKYVNPTTITTSTMPTLITVNTLLTRADIFVPRISSEVNTPTMSSRSEAPPSELYSLMRNTYTLLCLKTKKHTQ